MNSSAGASLADALSRLAQTRGDEDAWRILYDTMWPYVLAILYRELKGVGDLAEDASQDVFLRLLRYTEFDELSDPAAFKRYLRTVCVNVARDYLKQIMRVRFGDLDDDRLLQLEQAPVAQPSPEREVDARERLDALTEGLDEAQRRLLHLVSEGYTLDEIARLIGLSYTNVGVRLHRLRRELAKDPRFSDLTVASRRHVKKGPEPRS